MHTNHTELNINKLVTKRRKAAEVVYKKKTALSEHELQCWAYRYFKGVLIPDIAKYVGHESSIGLGFMPEKPGDSPVTKACKKFYNKFIKTAQQKFQDKGVEKGSSDGFLFYRNGVICLEFKVDYNKASAAQEEFAAEMALLGYPTEYPRTQEDVMAIPRKYGIKTRETR